MIFLTHKPHATHYIILWTSTRIIEKQVVDNQRLNPHQGLVDYCKAESSPRGLELTSAIFITTFPKIEAHCPCPLSLPCAARRLRDNLDAMDKARANKDMDVLGCVKRGQLKAI